MSYNRRTYILSLLVWCVAVLVPAAAAVVWGDGAATVLPRLAVGAWEWFGRFLGLP